jgi:serine O-acetyltransferase
MSIKSFIRVIKTLLVGSVTSKIALLLRLSRNLDRNSKLRRILFLRMQRYGVYISANAQIEEGLKLPHPVGIVIGEGVVIGKNVKLFQNVTLGGARIGDAKNMNYPILGDNVVIFAGAVIVGNIRIGDDSIIGANAVILKDVPDGATCVGVPGRILGQSRRGGKL